MPVLPPPLVALGFGLVQKALTPERRSGPAHNVAAAGVGAASIALLGGSAARFRRSHTTVEPFDPSKTTALVTDGPNALTRNPMYVGMAGTLTAHALLRGGWLTALPVIGFVALVDRLQVRHEEEALRQLFGEDYSEYCRRVPRWVGLPR